MNEETKGEDMGQVIQIDEARIKDHLGEMVRGTVEETLNALLDTEADRLCGAARYERREGRQDTRAGNYERSLHTKAGEVKLKVPKLRRQTFETAIIERYRRRESSVEEALVEMYLAGVSVRRVEDITEALWGTRVSSGTISNLNKKIYAQIETWRHRPIEGDHHIAEIQSHGRMAWQKASGYNQRSRIETLMSRWKAVIGPKLKARSFENQKTEAKIGVRILNRVSELRRPIIERTA